MSDGEIVRTLRQVRRRLMTVRAIESGLGLMLYGAGLAVAAVAISALAYSILPEWYPYPWAPMVLVPAAFLVGLVLRLVRPVTLGDAAIYLDRRAGLEERVSTAYELARQGDDGPLAGLVYGQALEICRRFRPRMIKYGRRLGWEVRYLAAALLACGAILFLPPYKTRDVRAREAYEARSRRTARQFKDRIRIIKRELGADDELQALLKKAGREADQLARAKMSPARPFAELNRLKGRMQQLQKKREAEKRLAEQMKKARRVDSVRGALPTDPSKANPGQLRRLADKVAGGRATQAEKSALRRVGDAAEEAGRASGDKALEQAGRNLKEAGNSSGGGDAKGLAEDMSRIARAAGRSGGNRDGGPKSGGGNSADGGRLAAAIDAVDRAKQALAGQGGQGGQGGRSRPASSSSGGGKQANSGSSRQGRNGGGSGRQQGPGGGRQADSGSGRQGQNGGGSGRQGAPGTGSTNMDAPSGPGGRTEYENPQAEAPWARIYRPRSTAHTKDRKFVPSRLGRGKSAGQITIRGKADPNDKATMDFTGDQEATGYERMRALEDEHIPAESRRVVQKYFDDYSP